MNAKERELFGPVGLDLIRASDIAYGSGHISVKRSYVEQPPQFLFDERVPAAKAILDRARGDQAYRRKLASCLASPVKLAAFLDDYNNHPSPWGTGRLNTNQQLYSDLRTLMGKAVTWSGPDLIRGAAREASPAPPLAAPVGGLPLAGPSSAGDGHRLRSRFPSRMRCRSSRSRPMA